MPPPIRFLLRLARKEKKTFTPLAVILVSESISTGCFKMALLFGLISRVLSAPAAKLYSVIICNLVAILALLF